MLIPPPAPLAMLPTLGFGELAILFVIVLILFGPGKLPEVCRALGDGIKQFKNAASDAASSVTGAAANGSSSAGALSSNAMPTPQLPSSFSADSGPKGQ
jgi:sec-independent protein translocase protein TatA